MTTTLVGKQTPEEVLRDLQFLEYYEDGVMSPEEYEKREERLKMFGTLSKTNTMPTELKPSNPKDMVGCLKTPFSVLPTPVMAEVALGMFEGALKYGRHNYRAVGVRASIYYDATMRHLTSWWEGEDLDPESGLSHITKAISSLTVLRDSMIRNNWEDDRPPATPDLFVELNKKAAQLVEQYKDRNPKHYTNLNIGEDPSVQQ